MASVQKHKARWRVKWRDETGKALYQSFATEREAQDAARKIEAHAVLDGKAPVAADPDVVTLAQWWSRWEPGRDWRPSSRSTHDVHWRLYIEPVFGKVALHAITTADVRKFHRVLEDRGLAPVTVGSIHRTLSMALRGALDDGLILRNPAQIAPPRRKVQSPPVALDTATTTALLDTIANTAPWLDTHSRLIATTGLRKAEAAGLTWDRIDLDNAVIMVDRQLDYSAPSLPAWCPPKTGKPRRVPINASTVTMLRAHRAAQTVTAIDGSNLVFTGPNGTPLSRHSVQAVWNRARTMLAETDTPLPPGARGWHTLRHTVASRLVESRDVSPKEAAEMLGHSPAMLLSTYAHIADRAAAEDRLRDALDG